jgi:hypothetical protein
MDTTGFGTLAHRFGNTATAWQQSVGIPWCVQKDRGVERELTLHCVSRADPMTVKAGTTQTVKPEEPIE